MLGLWLWATFIYENRPDAPTGDFSHPIHFFGVVHYGAEAERWLFLAAWWTGALWVIWCLVKSLVEGKTMDER